MKKLDEAVLALASKQLGSFSRRQAIAAGASGSACVRRLAAEQWLRTDHAGVFRLPGFAPSWRQRVMITILAGPESGVASHRAAAVLHGLREGTPLELTVPQGGNRVAHVLVHQAVVRPGDRCVIDGIPATRVERTLVDLAAVVADDQVEQAVEAALRQRLTTVDRLRAQLACRRPGVARLRRVLERRGKGRPAGSELEVRFVQLLRAAGLAEPVRQYEVRVGDERYFLDFAFPERRLCVELDGEEAHTGAAAFQRDRSRQNALVLMGWTVLRFTWADVTERPGQIVALLTQALAA